MELPPHAPNDFIFAILGEELGFLGAFAVIALFGILAYTGLRIAARNTDPWIRIVSATLTTWIVGQAAINIGYVVGLLPLTGIPLPLIASGGTSLVVTMFVFGILANAARHEAGVAAPRTDSPRSVASAANPRAISATAAHLATPADQISSPGSLRAHDEAATGGAPWRTRQLRTPAPRARTRVTQRRAQPSPCHPGCPLATAGVANRGTLADAAQPGLPVRANTGDAGRVASRRAPGSSGHSKGPRDAR